MKYDGLKIPIVHDDENVVCDVDDLSKQNYVLYSVKWFWS